MSNYNNGYIIKQLTNNSFDDENPQIWGNNIVWDAPNRVYLSKMVVSLSCSMMMCFCRRFLKFQAIT
ncbi:hypothetical protein HC931_21650 [Candidatus Gracilibacteria bacterium]|nr:hypothetical protein [Candidatus Gracilibacteria bacterium]NJQ98932.1 hypothetical protein [Hydrococcus sp. CSU_1_8]